MVLDSISQATEMSVSIHADGINSNRRIAINVLVAVDTGPIFHHRVENVWDHVLMDNLSQCIQIIA